MPLIDPDRLFPTVPTVRSLARSLYDAVAVLTIISKHGHCDPRWFAEDARFPNPAELFVVPDHYVFRMLVSQGMSLADLGVPSVDGRPVEKDPRKIWERFARGYHYFRGTPSSIWLDHSFEFVFGIDEVLRPTMLRRFTITLKRNFRNQPTDRGHFSKTSRLSCWRRRKARWMTARHKQTRKVGGPAKS